VRRVAREKSIKKNFIMNAILTVSNFLFPLITFPYVSRVLGPDGYGLVNLATSVVAYFALFAQLGIPTYGVRAAAKVRDDKEALSRLTQELFLINLFCSLIVYAVFFGALFTVPAMRSEKTLYLIMSTQILFQAIGLEHLYKGLEMYSYITIRSLIFKVIGLIGTFLLVKAEKDYAIYGAITVFATSASAVMNLLHARRVVDLKLKKNLNLKKHMKEVAIFFAMACATTVYLHLDNVMLGIMKTKTDVGYYGAAVRIKTILVSIVTSLGTVLLPRASWYVEKGEMDEFRKVGAKAVRFVWLFSFPLMIYFMIFAREGILFLSGIKYLDAILPMQIIMPTLLFIGFSNILGIQILVPIGREKTVLWSEIAGAVVDLILNAVLIPRYKSAGAAIGTLAAELVVLLWQAKALSNEERIPVREVFRDLPVFRVLFASAIGTGAAIWLKWVSLPLWEDRLMWHNAVILAVSAACFFPVYYIILLIAKEPMTKEVTDSILGKRKKRQQSEKADRKNERIRKRT